MDAFIRGAGGHVTGHVLNRPDGHRAGSCQLYAPAQHFLSQRILKRLIMMKRNVRRTSYSCAYAQKFCDCTANVRQKAGRWRRRSHRDSRRSPHAPTPPTSVQRGTWKKNTLRSSAWHGRAQKGGRRIRRRSRGSWSAKWSCSSLRDNLLISRPPPVTKSRFGIFLPSRALRQFWDKFFKALLHFGDKMRTNGHLGYWAQGIVFRDENTVKCHVARIMYIKRGGVPARIDRHSMTLTDID